MDFEGLLFCSQEYTKINSVYIWTSKYIIKMFPTSYALMLYLCVPVCTHIQDWCMLDYKELIRYEQNLISSVKSSLAYTRYSTESK